MWPRQPRRQPFQASFRPQRLKAGRGSLSRPPGGKPGALAGPPTPHSPFETSLLCLVDGVRSTPPGLKAEGYAALRASKNLGLSGPPHHFLPVIESSPRPPPPASSPGAPPPVLLASRARPGGRGEGWVRVPDCARVPPKSRETRLLPLLPPPLTSFPLTSRRRRCSKNKGRGHHSRC